jgi:hypothetical protein
MKINRIFETPPLPPYSDTADTIAKSAGWLNATKMAFFSVGRTSTLFVLDAVKRSARKIKLTTLLMAKTTLTRLEKAYRKLARAKLDVKIAKLIEEAVSGKPEVKNKTNESKS